MKRAVKYSWVCAGVWLCAGLTACNGVGRALVDQRPVDDPGKDLCGEPVPSCSDFPLPPEPAGTPMEAAPLDLQYCGASTTCPGSSQGLTGGGATGAGACETTLTTGHGPDAFAALAERNCAALRIVDDGNSEPWLELDGAHLESVNVTIDTKRALTLHLIGPRLAHVWFEFLGPVTLRIDSSREINDLRVTTPMPGVGRDAAVVLDSVNAVGMALGTAEISFQGELVMRRSSLHRATLHAASLDLESVSMDDIRIDTERFQASDTTMSRIAMSAGRSLLAGCTVTGLRMFDCGDFSAILGDIRNSRIAACTAPVRLYGASFDDGVLDGPVVLDNASLSRVRLGLRQPTTIEAWDSHVDHVRFCSPRQSISFGGSSSVACARCEGQGRQPWQVDACVTQSGTYESLGGPESCQALVEPPTCEEPEPTRMRPPY